jgi:glucokinase
VPLDSRCMTHGQDEGRHAARAAGWLLIDCAHQGEVRLAQIEPSAAPRLGRIFRYGTDIPIFTEVLLRFERESGTALRDLQAVVAVAGVPGRESTTIERTRWVISSAGLTSLFGGPPILLNEVAAQAWALRVSLHGVTPICGDGPPDLTRPGRYVFMTYEEGVGTAIVDIDDSGRCTVFDGEGGQIDFLPLDDAERALAAAVAASPGAPLSWEQVLMSARGQIAPTSQRSRLFARLLGRFVSNLVYASGAWNGAFLTGQLIPRAGELDADFRTGMTVHRPYHRLLARASAWRVIQTEPVLSGCAAMMASRHPGT